MKNKSRKTRLLHHTDTKLIQNGSQTWTGESEVPSAEKGDKQPQPQTADADVTRTTTAENSVAVS